MDTVCQQGTPTESNPLYRWYTAKAASFQAPEQPPVTVTATEAKKEIWNTQLATIGTLQAIQGISASTC